MFKVFTFQAVFILKIYIYISLHTTIPQTITIAQLLMLKVAVLRLTCLFRQIVTVS